MKFTCHVDIRKNREQTVALWSNPENLKHWQEGLLHFEHTEGTPGEVGSKSTMRYKSGPSEFDLVETIIENDLPNRFVGLYEAKSMVNTMSNDFIELDDQLTRWTAEIDYSEFRGLIPKLMAWLMPGLFKKQVMKWLYNFKRFAESQPA